MKFAVVTNRDRDTDFSVTKKIVDIIEKNDSEAVCTEHDGLSDVISDCDVIVTVGGDGTILGISHTAAKNGVPVIGVNRGHLGYLAEIEKEELSELEKVIRGEYFVERRMMLRADMLVSGKKKSFYALNDIVVSHGEVLELIDVDLFCDGVPVSSYRADGLIFATPTGSTAYSLSSGGPIVDPAHKAIILTPICPHTLSSRPVLFRENAELSVKCEKGMLYCDGGHGIPVENVPVNISVSPYSLRLIRLNKNSFYRIVSKKLH